MHDDRTTNLPTFQDHMAASAIVDACFRPAGFQAAQYSTDESTAYSLLPVQRADWWLQVRFWTMRLPDGSVLTGFFVCPRLLFGGAWGPNRFQRLMRMKRARVRQRQLL